MVSSQRMFGLDGPYDLWLTQEQSADDGSVDYAIQKVSFKVTLILLTHQPQGNAVLSNL